MKTKINDLMVLCICLLILQCSFSVIGADIWSQFAGDAQNTGYTTSGTYSTQYVKWVTDLGAGNWGGAVVGIDGKIIVPTNQGPNYLVALNPEDGSKAWEFPISDWVDGAPAVRMSDGSIYVGSNAGGLLSLTSDGSSVNWSYPTPAGLNCNILLGETGDAQDIVYIWNINGLQAIDANSGSLLWSVTSFVDGDGYRKSPALSPDGNQLYARAEGTGTLGAFDAGTGTLLWSFNTGSDWRLHPVVGSDGTVYQPCAAFGSNNHDFVVALNANDGSLIWSYDIGIDGAWWPGGICLTPDEDQVIIAGRGGVGLRAISAATGTLNWQFWESGAEPAVGDFLSPPVAGANGTIYGIDHNATVCAFSSTGTMLWKRQVPYPSKDTWFSVHLGIYNDGGLILTASNYDNSGDDVALLFAWPEDEIIIVTETQLPIGYQTVAYSTEIGAIGGASPYTWSVTSGSLPPGLTLDSSTGVISGIPTASGTYNFNIGVSDSTTPTPLTQEKAFSLKITIKIATTSLPDAVFDEYYKAPLVVLGGVQPITWQINIGSLPPGLTLNSSTGLIDGIPTSVGTFSFQVQATDSSAPAESDTKDLSIVVKQMPLDIMTVSVHNGVVDVPYVGTTFKKLGGDGGVYTW